MEKYRFRVEYLIKGMHPRQQREILGRLRKNFPDIYKRWLSIFKDDYKNGYDSLRATGLFYDNKSIDSFLEEVIIVFDEINEIMINNNYKPLFDNTSKPYYSWQQRDYLIEFLPEQILNEEFGCKTFDDFVAPKLEEPTSENERTPR